MDDFTYEELGALVAAVGMIMFKQGVCADAAQDGLSDDDIEEVLMEQFNIEEVRAKQLLAVSIRQAIEFIGGI
jgi:hypothetical protein